MVKLEQNQAETATCERRAEPRFKAGHAVLLRAAGAVPLEAWLLDVSSKGARLRISKPIPVGTTVTIEGQDLLLIGTIRHCELSHQAYEVGLTLSLPLKMLVELRKLNAALLVES